MADDFAILGLGVDSGDAVRGLNRVTQATGSMLGAIRQAAPALAGLFSAGVIVRAAKSFINAASDAQEAAGVLNDVFRGNERLLKRAGDAISELADKYAYSTAGASQQVSMTADTFHKFGVELAQSLDLSVEINKLGADLAAFTNYTGGSEGATRALTKALLGEREMAKTLGIVINEDTVKAQMQKDAKNGLTYATQQQAKMMATLAIIQQQSAAAQGKAIKEADNYSVKIRNLTAKWNDLKAALGEELIDPLTKLVSGITVLVDKFKGMSAETRSFTVHTGMAVGATLSLAGALKTVLVLHRMLKAAGAGAGVAGGLGTGGGAASATAGASLLGGTGVLGAGAITAVALSAGNMFFEGYKEATEKHKPKFEAVMSGVFNTITLGIGPAIKDATNAWKQFGKGQNDAVDASITTLQSAFDVLTLGISRVVRNIGESSGVFESFGNWFARLIHYNEALRERDLDSQSQQVRENQANRQAALRGLEYVKEDAWNYNETESAKQFNARDSLNRLAGAVTGAEKAAVETQVIEKELSEKREKLAEVQARYDENQAEIDAKYQEMRKDADRLEELRANYAADPDKWRGYPEGQERNLALTTRAYEEAVKKSTGMSSEEFENLKTEVTKLQNDLYAAQRAEGEAKTNEYIQKRAERWSQEDAEIQLQFSGQTSDEARAESARKSAEVLRGRYKEMEDALDTVRQLEADMEGLEKTTDRYQDKARALAEAQAMAGTVQERLSLQQQILDKEAEEADALHRITERENDLNKAREEQENRYNERSAQMAEEYANNWMNAQEKVSYNQSKFFNAQKEAAEIATRMGELSKMDEEIKTLAETAKEGGGSGLEAERKMNDLIKERAALEEKLNNDRSKNLEDQYSALNAIDAIAENKAQELAQEYQDKISALEQDEKDSRKGFSVQKAIDAASAEGFAQMNKIYDTSQRKIEDHTKNIKEYTRQMKQYLMQLAAQGKSDWALDVQGG